MVDRVHDAVAEDLIPRDDLACHESISIEFRVVILDSVEGADGVAHIAELDFIAVDKQVVLVSPSAVTIWIILVR
jgi:hypothetical protein